MRVAANLSSADAQIKFAFPAWKEAAVEPATYRLLVHRWEVKTSPEHFKEIALPSGFFVRCLLPDKRTLWLAGHEKPNSHFFDIETGSMRDGPRLAAGVDFAGFQFSPDDRTMAYGELRWDRKTSDLNGCLVLWDLKTSKEIMRLEQTPPRCSIPVAFSIDGRRLLCLERRRVGNGKEERDLAVWDLEKRTCERRPEPAFATYVPFPNRQLMAVATHGYSDSSTTTKIAFQEPETGKAIGEFSKIDGAYYNLLFTPDSKFLIGASQERKMVVWDVGAKRTVRTIEHEESEGIRGIAVSPDSKLLAVSLGGSGNAHKRPGAVAIWSLADGKRLTTLHGHTGPVGTVRFLDDRLLISNGFNEKLRYWNLERLAPSTR